MWAWPLAFPEAAKGLRLGRYTLVFQLWALRQKDWSDNKRGTETSRYAMQRASANISPILPPAGKHAAKK